VASTTGRTAGVAGAGALDKGETYTALADGLEFRNGAFVGTHRRSTLDEPTEISAVDATQ
jgi:hypothetical protein